MHTATDVLSGLRHAPMTDADLRTASQILRDRWDGLRRSQARKFAVGDRVSFEHQGSRLHGVVDKINQKTVSVRVGFAPWRVTASLLRAES